MDILHESAHCIIINKPAAVPIQPDKTGDTSLLEMAEKQVGYDLFLVHRIDRPVSGAVLFAKTKQAAAHYSKHFLEQKNEKIYLAAVRGTPAEAEGHLEHFILKNRNGKAHVVPTEGNKAKRAALDYRVIGKSDNYTFLEIKLLTGRHHQIRAQLAAIGCTIKGDVRYGDRRANKDRSIHLHAWKLTTQDSVNAEPVVITAQLPQEDAVWQSLEWILVEKGEI